MSGVTVEPRTHFHGVPARLPKCAEHGIVGHLHDEPALSCLGCGQIGTPSTIHKPSGQYLCAERCVPAIRAAESPPDLSGALLRSDTTHYSPPLSPEQQDQLIDDNRRMARALREAGL